MMSFIYMLTGMLIPTGILCVTFLHAEKKKREAIMEWAAAIRESGFSQEVAAEYMAFLDNC